MERIREFLGQKRLAMVGVSRQTNDFSRTLFRELRNRGYDVVPVHPGVREIEGVRCFDSVRAIEPPLTSVLLMTTPAVTGKVVRECAEAGVERVWMYGAGKPGAVSAEAVGFCESKGIAVIPGECPFMFLPAGAWYHRVHGWVKKITGTYPK